MKNYTDNELYDIWDRCCNNKPLSGAELNAIKPMVEEFLSTSRYKDEEMRRLTRIAARTDAERAEHVEAMRLLRAQGPVAVDSLTFDPRDNEFEDFRTKCEFEYVPASSRPLARQAELDDFEKQVSVVRVALATVLVVVVLAFVRVLM